jgi:hypothetical protein
MVSTMLRALNITFAVLATVAVGIMFAAMLAENAAATATAVVALFACGFGWQYTQSK